MLEQIPYLSKEVLNEWLPTIIMLLAFIAVVAFLISLPFVIYMWIKTSRSIRAQADPKPKTKAKKTIRIQRPDTKTESKVPLKRTDKKKAKEVVEKVAVANKSLQQVKNVFVEKEKIPEPKGEDPQLRFFDEVLDKISKSDGK